MLRMQTIGLSESTPRSESRLKSLFWPSIESGVDVDYLALQGFWVCTFVAALSMAFLLFARAPVMAMIVSMFFYLSGVGVREHSRFAATIIFVFYVIDGLSSLRMYAISPAGTVIRVIVTALLLSNLRATWIAAGWKAGSDESGMPARLDDTLTDKFSNRWPMWLWPKLRVPYYVLSTGFLLLVAVGLIMIALRAAR